MSTFLYFVRHGQTAANRHHRISGRVDLPLTELGAQQAASCRETLMRLNINAIYCSPLLRARQTAEIATEGLPNCPEIIYDERLLERDFGRVDGKFAPFAAIKMWDYDQSFARSRYGEETLLHLENRAQDFIEMIREKHPDQTVVVFSHGGIATAINAVLDDNHSREGNYFQKLHLKNGAISCFTL